MLDSRELITSRVITYVADQCRYYQTLTVVKAYSYQDPHGRVRTSEGVIHPKRLSRLCSRFSLISLRLCHYIYSYIYSYLFIFIASFPFSVMVGPTKKEARPLGSNSMSQ